MKTKIDHIIFMFKALEYSFNSALFMLEYYVTTKEAIKLLNEAKND